MRTPLALAWAAALVSLLLTAAAGRAGVTSSGVAASAGVTSSGAGTGIPTVALPRGRRLTSRKHDKSLVAPPVVLPSFQISAGYVALVRAINAANANAMHCTQASPSQQVVAGCLGNRVALLLTDDAFLGRDLPPLVSGAYLRIVGRCINLDGNPRKCVVHGQWAFKLFRSRATVGPIGRLELRNLILMGGNGGVINNVWGVVDAQGVDFLRNYNGVVSWNSSVGMPTHSYTNCRFLGNNGTAVTAGVGRAELAHDRVAFVFRKTVFRGNRGYTGTGLRSGGAVSLQGNGVSIFEDVQFLENVALESGGAVAAVGTEVKFRRCSFLNNRAARGPGGAFFGTSGPTQRLTSTFCTCSFQNNMGYLSPMLSQQYNSTVQYNTGYLSKVSAMGITNGASPEYMTNPVVVSFCDTPIPPGASFPPVGSFTLNNGNGRDCQLAYC